MSLNRCLVALTVALLFPLLLRGASVELNCFWYQPDEYSSSLTAGANGGRAFVSWWHEIDMEGNEVWTADAAPYPEISCAWMQVVPGDYLDEAFVRSRDGYFYKWNIYGEEDIRSDYDIIFPLDGDVWLGVAVGRNTNNPDDVLYGWVQFHRDQDLGVTMVYSALNLDGGGMLVGSIPEPSTGMLLLVGLALVGIIRPKQTLGIKAFKAQWTFCAPDINCKR